MTTLENRKYIRWFVTDSRLPSLVGRRIDCVYVTVYIRIISHNAYISSSIHCMYKISHLAEYIETDNQRH